MVKNLPTKAGNAGGRGLIPGSGRSPGGGNGNPLPYSCQKNSMDRGAWQATVHEVAKSWTWLSNWAHTATQVNPNATRGCYCCYLKPHGNKGIRGQISLENWLSSGGEKEFILDVCPVSDSSEPELFHFWFSKANRTLKKCFVQSLSPVWLFVTPWTAARQASLSFSVSQSLLKLMSIESVMHSNHLILCCPLFLLPSFFPRIRVFSDESALHMR